MRSGGPGAPRGGIPLSLLVHKYGGTSVGTTDRIRAVASRLAVLRAEGHDLIVVVSAMGDTTDELLVLAAEITDTPLRRELDMLLTAGERISMALLSMALNAIGCPAISFTGSQSGIITDTWHGQARIQEIRPVRIQEELARGRIVIIAGFQGVSRDREVTTLGRGGSDTSAVALAVTFQAEACSIYTDVDGVFTADPRHVSEATLIPRIDFDTMLEFSSRGAGVINVRAVELARTYRMPLVIRNSLSEHPGTRVEGECSVEGTGIVGVTTTPRVIRIRFSGPMAAAGIVDAVMTRMSETTIEPLAMDMDAGSKVSRVELLLADSDAAGRFLAELHAPLIPESVCVEVDRDLAAVSLISGGPLRASHTAPRAAASLGRAGIPFVGCRTETLSYRLLVPAESAQEAVRVLHREFLGERPTAA